MWEFAVRLRMIVDRFEGGDWNAFAETTGIPLQDILTILTGDQYPQDDWVMDSICNSYGINFGWLCAGGGERLKF